MIKAALTTTNSDEVSGTTTFEDGTKAYWSEGRASDVNILGPSGKRYTISADHNTQLTPYLREIFDALSDGDLGAMRKATYTEEHEHNLERNGGRNS